MGIGNDIRPKNQHKERRSTLGSREKAGTKDESTIKKPETIIELENNSTANPEREKNQTQKDVNVTLKSNDDSFFDSKQESNGENDSGLKVVIVLLSILLLFGALFAYIFFSPNTPTTEPDTTENQSDTPSTSTTEADQKTLELSLEVPETPKPAATPAPTVTTPDPAKITVQVLNGNGIKGSAQTVADLLNTSGFKVGKATNANSFSYAQTIIYYKTGKTEELELVKKTLAKSVLEELNNTLTGNNDILIVVGKDWK